MIRKGDLDFLQNLFTLNNKKWKLKIIKPQFCKTVETTQRHIILKEEVTCPLRGQCLLLHQIIRLAFHSVPKMWTEGSERNWDICPTPIFLALLFPLFSHLFRHSRLMGFKKTQIKMFHLCFNIVKLITASSFYNSTSNKIKLWFILIVQERGFSLCYSLGGLS